MTPPESTVWECHGTGTSLGDPIEVGAVRKVQIKMARKEPLMIGTSKSNIGHLEGSAAMVAICKCCLTVINGKCCPTIHFKTLNAHLDHAAFDAFFATESNPYLFDTGHCQVSSFGVGGTNGHAIFFGEDMRSGRNIDVKKAFLCKLKCLKPKLIVDGGNPETWEYHGMPIALDPNEDPGKWSVQYVKDPFTGEESMEYTKEEEAGPAEAVEGEEEEPTGPEYYSVTANFNEWSDDRMMEGDVPNLYFLDVEVPSEGFVEFRILVEGDTDKQIAPPTSKCKRKTAEVLGPEADLGTSWLVEAPADTQLRIELLIPTKGQKYLTWYKMR